MTSSDLDAWAEENYRLSNLTTKGEREFPSKINIIYLYWEVAESRVSQIHTQTHVFDISVSKIQMDTVRSYIDMSKYKIVEMFLYCVEIEPDHVPAYITSTSPSNFMKIIKEPVTEISVPASLFVFHEVNGLYVMLVDAPKTRSILKTKKHIGGNGRKSTKRVSFHE